MQQRAMQLRPRYLAGILLVLPAMSFAQLTSRWHSVDNGMSVVQGGPYTATLVAGQPDASTSPACGPEIECSTARFSANGGFIAGNSPASGHPSCDGDSACLFRDGS